jgi:hypothetical protein
MGLGAVTMALPPLEAFGQRASGKNLVIVQIGNGAPLDHWLNMSIPQQGLGNMASKCTVVRGVSLRTFVEPLLGAGNNGHASGSMTLLTSRHAVPDPADTTIGHRYKATGESIDHAIARLINAGRPSRYWGLCHRTDVVKQSCLSYISPDQMAKWGNSTGTMEAFV